MILPLHQLNEMDGLGPDARVLLVLTTNRREVPTCSSPRSPHPPAALGDRVRSGGKLSARLAGAEGAVGFV